MDGVEVLGDRLQHQRLAGLIFWEVVQKVVLK